MENQFGIDIPYSTIKQRLIDNLLQSWYASINNSSTLQTNCIYKHSFEIDNIKEFTRK